MEPYYDERTRTFTGYIDWRNSPLEDGITKIDFKIIFSDDFQLFIDGYLRRLNIYDEIIEEYKYGLN